MVTDFQAPRFRTSQLFTIFVITVLGAACYMALSWDFSAKIVPLVIGSVALLASRVSLFNDMCRQPEAGMESLVDQAMHEVEPQLSASDSSGRAAAANQKTDMGLLSETGHLPLNVIVTRAARFFGYLLVFMGIMAVIGLIPTIGFFVVFFMRYENSERWPLIITYATVLVIAVTFVFEHVMHIPWPPTLLGQWFPELKSIIPSLS